LPRSPSNKSKYPVKSLIKALRILDVLAESSGGRGITEVSQALKLGKSTVHRLLATLKDEGFVLFDPVTSRYILGSRVAKLGHQVSRQNPLLTFGVPIVQRLARECNETANLGILEGTEVVYIAGEESREVLHNRFLMGYRAPAHSTALGKTCLSDLSMADILSLFKNTKRLQKVGLRTLETVKDLLAELEAVRQAGIAYDNEESGPGVRCIAAPVRDFSGKVVAALSLSMPKHRLTNERKSFFKGALLRATTELSGKLGYLPSDSYIAIESLARRSDPVSAR
jgi:DNA-binding IclR family transcriptional regulator